MWVKKTEDEIKNEKDNFKLSYVAPILTFIVTPITYFIFNITGTARTKVKSISVYEYLAMLPEIIGVGIILSMVVLLLQKMLKKNFLDENKNKTTVICDKCNDKKTDNANYSCKCGGTFIIIKKMKWIEGVLAVVGALFITVFLFSCEDNVLKEIKIESQKNDSFNKEEFVKSKIFVPDAYIKTYEDWIKNWTPKINHNYYLQIKEFNDSLFNVTCDSIYIYSLIKEEHIVLFHFKTERNDTLTNYIELININTQELIDILSFTEGIKGILQKDTFNLSFLTYSHKDSVSDFQIDNFICFNTNYDNYLHPFFNKNQKINTTLHKISDKGIVQCNLHE